MVSRKLQVFFWISLVLIYLHGVGEIATGFHRQGDQFMVVGANFFSISPELFYWVFHIIWWLLIPAFFLTFRHTTFILPLMTILGTVFFIEVHHIVKAMFAQSYYPGMITAFFYPVVGFFYWKELLQSYKTTRTKT